MSIGKPCQELGQGLGRGLDQSVVGWQEQREEELAVGQVAAEEVLGLEIGRGWGRNEADLRLVI